MNKNVETIFFSKKWKRTPDLKQEQVPGRSDLKQEQVPGRSDFEQENLEHYTKTTVWEETCEQMINLNGEPTVTQPDPVGYNQSFNNTVVTNIYRNSCRLHSFF